MVLVSRDGRFTASTALTFRNVLRHPAYGCFRSGIHALPHSAATPPVLETQWRGSNVGSIRSTGDPLQMSPSLTGTAPVFGRSTVVGDWKVI